MDAKTESQSGLRPPFKKRYENFIGGGWVAPVAGKYFRNPSPVRAQRSAKFRAPMCRTSPAPRR
jgi:hypothetical protein